MQPDEQYLECPLSECRCGEEGEIAMINGDCCIARRLHELGIEPGARMRIMQDGSPLIIHTGQYRLCLRSELANAITLRIAADSPAAESVCACDSFE